MEQGDAVIIGVGSFRSELPADAEPEVGAVVWEELEFVGRVVPRVENAPTSRQPSRAQI
ncbi:hypothetical protein ACFCYF_37715 [Streptomyces chartreusis]|uniref:hypothetical protein n=1 Tax=Streptomyces chartreusis TaxID=1969 RepID=UPI0035E13B22